MSDSRMKQQTLPTSAATGSQSSSSSRLGRVAVVALVFLAFIFISFPSLSSSARSVLSQSSSMASSPSHSGWRRRSSPHPDGPSYTPTRDTLVFALTRSTPVHPDGFTIALFEPNVAVDAMGQVVRLAEDDFHYLKGLAQRSASLPATGGYRNQWRIKRPRTDGFIDEVHVAKDTSSPLHIIGIYGYPTPALELSKPVGDYTKLADELDALLVHSLEAREDYDKDRRDVAVIDKVRALL